MTDNSESTRIRFWERILRSRIIRDIFRIQVGFSFVRIWSMDVQMPRGTTIHLFDYLLYRRTNKEEPFEQWIRERELLIP